MRCNPKHSAWRTAKYLQLVFACAGLLAVLYCAWAGVRAYASQKAASAFQNSPQVARSSDSQEQILPGSDDGDGVLNPTAVIARLEIPQIALSVPVTASVTKEGLLSGAGHVPGTAFPGGLGTMGIAGHRDTYFRPLRRIHPGMQVKIVDATGAYQYLVDSTEIVDPDQVKVLDIAARPMLTLITCYPFNYVGAAPRRFIVHAHLLSVAPGE
jgi:sortase A